MLPSRLRSLPLKGICLFLKFRAFDEDQAGRRILLSGLQPCCRNSVMMFAPCLTHGSSARWTKKVGRRQRRNRDF